MALFCAGATPGRAETSATTSLLARYLDQRPDSIPAVADQYLTAARRDAARPARLWRSLAGFDALAWRGSPPPAVVPLAPGGAGDPLREAFIELSRHARGEPASTEVYPGLPDVRTLPRPLRAALARLLRAGLRARALSLPALAALPATATPSAVMITDDSHAVDWPGWLAAYETTGSLQGMQLLLTTTQEVVAELRNYQARGGKLPRRHWRMATPFGLIGVDIDSPLVERDIEKPFVWLSLGGGQTVRFHHGDPGAQVGQVSLWVQIGGWRHYLASASGADPSAGIMGLGLLWQEGGCASFHGQDLTQAVALLGAGALINRAATAACAPGTAGGSHFEAAAYAQAFAQGGMALLLGSRAADLYRALSHAQAAAGPRGSAWLIEPAGDDLYQLEATPLRVPSPQLPERNVSMGQGAARGWREGPVGGGLALLADLAGNDQYQAQVFAQGAGYGAGVGFLVEAGGDNRFQGAWYVQGAAAHAGVGALINRGQGNDDYYSTHSVSLGAGHDQGLGWFADAGGDDRYRVGALSLGVAHEGGRGFFQDTDGRDRYTIAGDPCTVAGMTIDSQTGQRARAGPRIARFDTSPRSSGSLPACPP